MAREPEARSSRGLEGRTLRRCRIAHLIAGEVEADHPPTRKAPCLARERDVVLRRVLAHGADDRDRMQRSGIETGQHGGDHRLNAEPAAQVQSWGPADLEVV